MTGSDFDPGSFRDPLSRVHVGPERVLRGFSQRGVADFRALEASGLSEAAVSAGRLIETTVVDADELGPDWELVVSHPKLRLITYPYEWTFSMLRDAALLQLELTAAAIDRGLITKDATPYNVQFDGSRPVFIDVGSFEVLQPGSQWFGYRQFCQLFLNPLLLRSLCGVSFRPWLRGSIDGIEPSQMASMISARDKLRPGVLANVVLHARSDSAWSDPSRGSGSKSRPGFSPALLRSQVQGLWRLVNALNWDEASEWSDYHERPHYGDADLVSKERFVESVCAAAPGRTVLDLGANDGRFSEIAARYADLVIAADIDEAVVDCLYRKLSAAGDRRIIPVAMDVVDGSPSLGWRGVERPSFVERSGPEVVLALALVHHLAITRSIPPAEIVGLLVDLDAEIVVEVPHRDDPMVVAMLGSKRSDLFSDYGVESFRRLFQQRFDVVSTDALPSGTRTMFHLRPRS